MTMMMFRRQNKQTTRKSLTPEIVADRAAKDRKTKILNV